MGRVKWTMESREKLEEAGEYFTQTGYSIITFDFGFGSEELENVACHKVGLIVDDFRRRIHSSSLSSSIVQQQEEVDFLIRDYRSKLDSALQYVCDNIHYPKIKSAFQQLLDDFRTGHVCKHNKNLPNPSPFAKTLTNYSYHKARKGDSEMETNKAKAPQLTEIQPQKDDEFKACLAKLNKEIEDYENTFGFLCKFVIDSDLVFSAYTEIEDVYYYLRSVALTKEDEKKLCDDKVCLIIRESRSKVESQLSNICENVSDLTLKNALSKHLADFKTGFKRNQQNRDPHLEIEDEKIMSSKPKMSVKKKKKKSKLRRKRVSGGYGSCTPPNNSQDLDNKIDAMVQMSRIGGIGHDHSKCCRIPSEWEGGSISMISDLNVVFE